MAALVHRHVLQGLQREIFGHVIGGKAFLQNDHLIANLAEPNQEIAMGRGSMDLKSELGEGAAGGFEPLRS